MNRLKLDQITYSYSKNKIINGLNLEIIEGEIVCLIGESGTGKTTLLRIIAGLEIQDKGSVLLDGKVISNNDYNLETHKRNIGLVLQERALFPHLDVFKNVTFGMRASLKEKNNRCDELLNLFKITKYKITLGSSIKYLKFTKRIIIPQSMVDPVMRLAIPYAIKMITPRLEALIKKSVKK